MHKLRGIIYIISAATFYGVMPILVKLAYETGLTAMDITFMRCGIGAIMLGVVIRYEKINFHVEKQQIVPMLLSGMLGYTATMLTLFLSYNYVSAGVATTLHYLYPVLVLLVAFFIYHEKLHPFKWLALLLSLVGVYFIADLGGRNFSIRGVGLAISSAVFFTVYVLSINHPQLKKMDSLVLAFYTCFIASIASFILFLVQGKWPPMITLKGSFYVSLITIFCTVLAMILFIKGAHSIGSANASILSTVEPLVSLVAGIIFLHESLTFYTLFGCILVIVAVIFVGYADLQIHFSKSKKAGDW